MVERKKSEQVPGLGSRIQEAAKLCGSVAELSRQTDISKSVLFKWIREESEPTAGKIFVIARASGLNPDWLLTGAGKKRVIDKTSGLDATLRPVTGISVEYQDVDPDTVSQELQHMVVAFSEHWLLKSGLSDAMLYLQRASGSSMEPTILDGDTMLISALYQVDDRGTKRPGIQPDESFQEEAIYSVKIHGRKPEIRRLQPDPEGGFLLSADNVNRPDIRVSADKLKIIGRVEWIGRRL